MVSRQFNQPERDPNPEFRIQLEGASAGLNAANPASQSDSLPSDQPHSPLFPRWLLIGLTICCALGATAVGAYLWLTALPPATNCEQVSPFSPDRERLYCAQEAARSGELNQLVEGLDLVGQWSPNHPLHREAQTWLQDWSKSVLTIAQQKVAQDDLTGAIAAARQIPKASPLYAEAQTAIADWQNRHKQEAAIVAAAQTAMRQQQWDKATQQIQALSELKGDRSRLQRVNALSQRLLIEKRGREIITQADRLAHTNRQTNISEGMTLLSQIAPNTYAAADAKIRLKQWGNTLLNVGLQQWRAGKLDIAMRLGQQAALSPDLAQEAQHLIRLSEARKSAIGSVSNWQASPMHAYRLMEAIAAAKQIPTTSRFYPQAHSSVQSWQAQLKDVAQLQFAQWTADSPVPGGLKLAIGQAQQVPQQNLRRIQAQTLSAYWSKEMQRREDLPYLARARQAAEKDTISALNYAIEFAKLVEPGRLLHAEAQSLVAGWQRRVQILQDRPLLDRAWSLARQGDFGGAIRTAAQIGSSRALYDQSQIAIDEWQARLRDLEAERRAAAQDAIVEPPPESDYVSPIEQVDSKPFEMAPAPLQKAPQLVAPLPPRVEWSPAPRSAPLQLESPVVEPAPPAAVSPPEAAQPEIAPPAVETAPIEPAPPPEAAPPSAPVGTSRLNINSPLLN